MSRDHRTLTRYRDKMMRDLTTSDLQFVAICKPMNCHLFCKYEPTHLDTQNVSRLTGFMICKMRNSDPI